jgi:hypothetical protein
LTLEDFIANTVENSMAVVRGCGGACSEASMVAHNALPYSFRTAGDMGDMSQLTSMPSFMGNHLQGGQPTFGGFAHGSSAGGWPEHSTRTASLSCNISRQTTVSPSPLNPAHPQILGSVELAHQ